MLKYKFYKTLVRPADEVWNRILGSIQDNRTEYKCNIDENDKVYQWRD